MADSRFNIDNFIVGVDNSFISANLKRLKEVSTSTYVIPPRHACRLDLISNLIYGSVNMKALLIYVNDIFDVSVVKHGYKLKYPQIKDILSVMNEVSDYKK
jgi:hypothetical protein